MHRCVLILASGAPLLLSGCVTLASGVAVSPPDINKISFRECLLDRGFYSYDPLTGIALLDWRYRHDPARGDRRKDKPRDQLDRYRWLEQSDAEFVLQAAERISSGVLPAQEYRDWRTAGRSRAVRDGSAAPAGRLSLADYGSNYPYVSQGAPQRYPVPRNPSDPVPGPDGSPSLAYEGGTNWRLNRFLDCYIAPVGIRALAYEEEDPARSERSSDDGSAGASKRAGPAAGGGEHDPADMADDGEPAGLREHGDMDVEGRLLRGHILLALLAQYGTELVVSRPSRRQVAQAELLLGHIKDAETSLRKGSIVVDAKQRAYVAKLKGVLTGLDAAGTEIDLTPPDAKAAPAAAPAKKPLPEVAKLSLADPRVELQIALVWKEYTTRVLRIIQVGVDIQRIDAEQTLDRFGNLLAAFSGAGGGFQAILEDGLSGIVTVQKVRLYGGAYLRDARASLAVARSTTKYEGARWTYDVPALTREWKLWDAEIDRACQVLATVAKKDPAGAACIPAPDEKPFT